MALIKLQDRLKIYNTVLTRIKRADGTGICYHLGVVCHYVTGYNFIYSELMQHFPEIDKHRPIPQESSALWWKTNTDGYAMRRWVMRESIKEVNRKLLKYQKLQQS